MAFKWYQSKREENLTHKLTVAPKELTRGNCRQCCRCLKKEYRYANSAFMHWRFYKEPNANIFGICYDCDIKLTPHVKLMRNTNIEKYLLLQQMNIINTDCIKIIFKKLILHEWHTPFCY